MKRWGNMARVFTKLGKEITIAVKAGGGDPETNPRLRVLMQTAKKENMPKENVERAIKKATSKDFSDYKEMNYEGYGPFGIAIFVETATDNTTRTVANVRSYFNKFGGSLGTTGSLEFLFDHKCIFHSAKRDGMGVEELEEDENEIILHGAFSANAQIQAYLESAGYEITSAEFVRLPNDTKPVTPEQRETLTKLIDKLEEDEDVQNVFTNMQEEEEEE